MASKAFLEQAYLAYFGRPVDPNGAAAYENSTEAEVENAFWASPESQALYGDLFGVQQINMVYNILFGRDAEQAGLAYWANQIVIGALTPAGAAIGILRGALNDDIIVVNNKLAASAAFTAGLDTTEEILGFVGDEAAAVSREWLATVTMTPATQAEVDTAIAAAVGGDTGGGDTGGQTFEFTLGKDIFNGTAYNDIFSGFVGVNNNGDDISTVQTWDTINGGNGNDTLSLLLTYDYTIDPTMVNVETISARFADSTGAHIDFANITGVNTLEIRDTNGNYGYIESMNVSDEITTYKFTNVARQIGFATMYLEFNTDVFTSDADEITVQLANAGNPKNDWWANLYLYNDNGDAVVEVMNVESKGVDNLFSYWDIYGASVLNTVNVTGDTSLNLWISSQEALTTLDAASFDAGLTFQCKSAKGMSITTGAGKDVIDVQWSAKDNVISTGAGDDTVITGDNLAAANLLNGGAGTDTLGMTSAAAIAASALTGTASTDLQALFSNFEVLSLADSLGTGTIDMAKLDGMNSLVLNGHDGATVNGLTSGATIEETFFANFYMTVNMTGAGTGAADVLNLKMTSSYDIREMVAAAGVETINVVTTDTDTTAHTNALYLDVANATSVIISGNTGVNVFSLANNFMITNFDASGISGAAADASVLGVTFASDNATDTATVTIKGGSGNDDLTGFFAMDVITGGLGDDYLFGMGGKDTLNGGDGADTLFGGVAADMMTGGAGKDIFQYGATATDSNGVNTDTVTDFVSGTDKIDTATTVTYVGGANGYGAVLTSLTGVAYQGVLDTSTSTLFIDVDGNKILDTADMVINLTGVTTLAATDFM